MKIPIDIALSQDGTPIGVVFIDLSPTAPASNTGLPGMPLATPLQAIAALQADKTKLQAAGFLKPTNIPGHPAGTTCWDIIVAEANKATASPEVKALNLT